MNFDVKEWSKKTNEKWNKSLMEETKRLDVYIGAWIQKAMKHHNKTIDQVELERHPCNNLQSYILVDKETKKKLLEITPEEPDIYSNIAFSYNAEIME